MGMCQISLLHIHFHIYSIFYWITFFRHGMIWPCLQPVAIHKNFLLNTWTFLWGWCIAVKEDRHGYSRCFITVCVMTWYFLWVELDRHRSGISSWCGSGGSNWLQYGSLSLGAKGSPVQAQGLTLRYLFQLLIWASACGGLLDNSSSGAVLVYD